MVDRCAGCGWPLQGNFSCCFKAGYWSQRAPLPKDMEMDGDPLFIEGYYFYGNPNNPLLHWSPLLIEITPGWHPGYPPLVRAVYQGHLDKSARSFGVRSLMHYAAFMATIAWAEREIAVMHHVRELEQRVSHNATDGAPSA